MKENQRESKRMKGQILAISDYLRLQASKSLPCVDQNCRGAWCWQVLVGTAYGFAGSLWDSSQVLSTFSKRISILGTGYAEHIGLELVWIKYSNIFYSFGLRGQTRQLQSLRFTNMMLPKGSATTLLEAARRLPGCTL